MTEGRSVDTTRKKRGRVSKAASLLASIDVEARKKGVALLLKIGVGEAVAMLEEVASCDPSLEIRFLAKKALSRIRGRGAAPSELGDLLEKLKDGDPAVRRKAASRLAKMGVREPAVVSALERAIRNERVIDVKRKMVKALGACGGREQLPLLLRYAEHEEERLRTAAVSAMAATGCKLAYPWIVKALGDDSSAVRKRAVSVLMRLGKGKMIALLERMLQSSKHWMRYSAASAIGRINSRSTVELAQRALASCDDPSLEKVLMRSLKRLARKGNQAASFLLERLRGGVEKMTITELDLSMVEPDSRLASPSPVERLDEVQRILSEKDVSFLKDILRRLHEEDDPKVLSAMIMAVGRLGDSGHADELLQFMTHRDARVRASVVEAVGVLGDELALRRLEPLLDDPDNRVRANAVVALSRLEGVDVHHVLERMVEEGDSRMKMSAIYAILELCTPEAVELLEELKGDADTAVAAKARQALRIVSDASFVLQPRKGPERELPADSGEFADIEEAGEIPVSGPSDLIVEEGGAAESAEEVREPAVSAAGPSGGEGGGEDGAGGRSGDTDVHRQEEAAPAEEPAASEAEAEDDAGGDAVRDSGETPAPAGEADDAASPGSGEKARAARKLAGTRTEIDEFFARAVKAKLPTRKQKRPSGGGKRPPGRPVGEEGPWEQILSLLGQGESEDAKGAAIVRIAMLVVLMVLVVLLVMVMSAGPGEEDDEYYDDEDF